MHKLTLSSLFVFCFLFFSHAQWDDTTTTNDVGIGTDSPSQRLDVVKDNAPQIRFSNKDNSVVEGGGYLVSDGAAQAIIVSGAEFTGTNVSATDAWTARTTESSGIWNNWGDIRFFTDTNISGTFTPTERMRLEDNGFLGIGTIVPVNRLDVVSDNAAQIRFSNKDNSTNNGGGYLVSDGAAQAIIVSGAEFTGTNVSATDAWTARTTESSGIWNNWGEIRFFTDTNISGMFTPTERMRLESNGFLGIGTNEPQHRLDVVSDNAAQIRFANKTSSTNDGGGYLVSDGDAQAIIVSGAEFTDTNVTTTDAWTARATESSGIWNNWGEIMFFTDAFLGEGNKFTPTERMRITDDGKVGIGVKDPQNTLSVNGSIWAMEIKVRLTDGADWVFEDDYDLRALKEVEAYILENKHLPDVPSADEMRENDLNVAEMDNILLQKIEELTLYLIEQNKEIEKLKVKNQALEERLESMEKY